MATDNLSQLVGVLGAWLDAAPPDASTEQRSQASALILGGVLLGVGSRDVDAPELNQLTVDQQTLVSSVRKWAFPDEVFVPSEPDPTPPTEAPEPKIGNFAAAIAGDQPDPPGPNRSRGSVEPGPSEEAPTPTTEAVARRRVRTPFSRTSSPRAPVAELDSVPRVFGSSVRSGPDLKALANTVKGRRNPPAIVGYLNREGFWLAICVVAVLVLIVRRLF